MGISGIVTALSGEPVSGAEIFAVVDLEPVNEPRRWSPFSGQKIRIMSIKGSTDQQGRFSVNWTSIPEGSSPFGLSGIMRYRITVKVTDLNGESHTDDTYLDCGKETVRLTLAIPESISTADSIGGSLGALSSDVRSLSIPVKLKISKLSDPSRTWTEPVLPLPDRFIMTAAEWQNTGTELPYNNEHLPSAWEESGMILERQYTNDSLTKISVPSSGKWQKGWYKVELAPVDPLICKPVIRYFRAEEPDPSKIDGFNPMYADITSAQLHPGQSVRLNFASAKKGFMLIEISRRTGDPLTGWYTSAKKTKKISWTVGDDWQGGAVVRVFMVRSNRIYEKTMTLSIPWKHSKLELSGFENLSMVKPGDSVTLDLMVRDDQGFPARASVGMTVYDASLDQVFPHGWTPVIRRVYAGGPSFEGLGSGPVGSFPLVDPPADYIDVAYVEPVSLNWFGLGYYGISRMDAPLMKMAMAAQPENARGAVQAEDAGARKDAEGESDKQIEEEMPETLPSPLLIRKDFRETAVFEGNVLTDDNGMARIKFKVPEVFTEWRILATGHDQNLAFGIREHHFKSAADLMLKANIPGFMRSGDSLELAARLGWYGKEQIRALTSLTIRDSSGNMVQDYQPVSSELSPGRLVPFFWPFTAKRTGKLTYVAHSSSASIADGLQDTITIYPDEVRLWNSQPFFLAKPGKKQLTVQPDPIEAVFEVTTTPAWQILQSLPLVVKQERDCSEYWFSRLYLACLAGNISDRYPAVAEEFLSDTTVMAQKDRISQLRDWMNADSRLTELAYVLEKLSNLQNQDGTWPWFKGMGSDLFMTQQIIAGFGEMKTWGIFDVTATQRGNYMVTQAIEAMDKWMYGQFREIIRRDSIHPQRVHLNPMVIHYVYARSFFTGLTMGPANEIAWLHFTERIPLEWTRHDPGLQALMGISSVQLGRMAYAMPIYRSLRERAKVDEQWGMYWPRKGFGSSWFEWDLWMQSRMIEFFAGIEEAEKDIDQLKLYLIHQKRGRDWGNGMVAAWASRSLLFYGNDLSVKPASVGMTWGSEQYSPLRIQTGSTGITGYYRFEWKDSSEIPRSGSMEVTKTEGGPAWGTLFTLQNYSLDRLSAAAGPLGISRDVMVRDPSGRWNVLTRGQVIRVGELVRIRLTVRSDRELSYIEIKDHLATGFMPVQVLSGYQYRNGLSSYLSREPACLSYYVPQLPKGTSTIEYQAIAEQAGSYFGGYATATSLYAPEFRAWSDSYRIHSVR
jgi:hypothetical protein